MWDSSHTLTHHTINQIGTSHGTFLLFLITSLNFLFSVTVGRSFRLVEPRFPHKAKALEKKPTKLGNVLTILNLRSGNMGTGEPFFSSSQPLSIPSSRWLWVEVSNLLKNCKNIFINSSVLIHSLRESSILWFMYQFNIKIFDMP